MVTLVGIMIMAGSAAFVAGWAWRYQVRVLELVHPARLLSRMHVRVVAVVVHGRSVMVGVRDEADHESLLTLVATTGPARDSVVATLEGWCADGAHLELDRATSGRGARLRHIDERWTLAVRFAA